MQMRFGFIAFSALTLLAGRQAGHPVVSKNLRCINPPELWCCWAEWEEGHPTRKNSFQHALLSRGQTAIPGSPGKLPRKQSVWVYVCVCVCKWDLRHLSMLMWTFAVQVHHTWLQLASSRSPMRNFRTMLLASSPDKPHNSSYGVLNVAFTVLSFSTRQFMTLEAYPGLTPTWARHHHPQVSRVSSARKQPADESLVAMERIWLCSYHNITGHFLGQIIRWN